MFHTSFNKPRKEVCYTLIITFPDGAVHSFPVGDAAITIGRSPATAIRVPEDGVSRQHCVISRAVGRLIVLDQGSTNGTFVNGALVKQARLSDGDVVQVGSTRIRVEVSDTAEAEPVLRPTQPSTSGDEDEIDTLTFELTGQTQVLHRLTERLASSEGAASAAEMVLDAIFEVFPIDRAYILTRRRDRTGSIPEVLASKGRASSSEITGEINVDIPKIVLDTLSSDPNITNASEATAAMQAALSDRTSNPVMCAPLRHGGETFGALYLDALTLPVWAHSSEMLDFLSSLGALTALSLTRARLQSELSLEQHLSQHRRESREILDEVTERSHRPAQPSIDEVPESTEALRQLQRLNVEVTQDLLRTVSSQVSSLDERLSAIGKNLDEGSDGTSAILEAMASAQRIVTSVEDVARLAELEAGQVIKINESSSVAPLIERAVQRQESFAEDEGVQVVVGSIEEGLEAHFDHALMNRVLEHLITAALSYTSRGGRVIISGSRRAANVDVVVADTGKGVPNDRRNTVFSGEPVGPEDRGGVEMYFCRRVVEAHSGSIRITGPTGNNRVIISLPARD